MANSFIVVIGAPRTGTSLACDLVKRCGFNFGKEAYYTDIIRDGRNEHPLTRTLAEVTEKYSAHVIESFDIEEINASKIYTIRMYDWLKVFNKHYNLKVVIVRRAYENSLKSYLTNDPKSSVPYYKDVLNMLDNIIEEDNGYDKLVLHFEDLISNKTEPLIALKTFLNSNVSIEELEKIIQPEAVIFG